MRRILQVVGRMDRAGQETFLMNVLRTHDSKKYEITFSVNTAHIGAYEAEILTLGGKIWHNPYAVSPKTWLLYMRSFSKFLKEQGPFDVIHCHVYYFGGFIMKVAKEAGIPIRIMHSHNTNDGKTTTILRNIYRKISLFLIRKYSTNFVACGVDAYEALFKEECTNPDKILNNAIIMDDFHNSQEQIDSKRKELGISNKTKVVINIARFCKVKNHEKMINVFNDFHNQVSDSIFLLVGNGERMDYIKSLVKKYKLERIVMFMGLRSDISELLSISDVLLMPSIFEGLPVSLIEAQASGLPCAISDTITKEVDMNLEIVKFIPLNSDDSIWAENLLQLSEIEKPSFNYRYSCLKKKGYTIDSTWEKLNKIYE